MEHIYGILKHHSIWNIVYVYEYIYQENYEWFRLFLYLFRLCVCVPSISFERMLIMHPHSHRQYNYNDALYVFGFILQTAIIDDLFMYSLREIMKEGFFSFEVRGYWASTTTILFVISHGTPENIIILILIAILHTQDSWMFNLHRHVNSSLQERVIIERNVSSVWKQRGVLVLETEARIVHIRFSRFFGSTYGVWTILGIFWTTFDCMWALFGVLKTILWVFVDDLYYELWTMVLFHLSYYSHWMKTCIIIIYAWVRWFICGFLDWIWCHISYTSCM